MLNGDWSIQMTNGGKVCDWMLGGEGWRSGSGLQISLGVGAWGLVQKAVKQGVFVVLTSCHRL